MREVVTVQAGKEANWVGAYFWALQEQQQYGEGGQDTAAASSVLYESPARSGAVAPRALLFDAPEAFNPFRAIDQGGGDEEEEGNGPAARAAALTWGGGVDVHLQQQQQAWQGRVVMNGGSGSAADSPSTWAEAWHGLHSWPQLARHCVAHISGSSSSNSSNSSSAEGSGWSDERGGDQLRRLLEGCDAPQGAHVLVDLCGPWLGYGVGAAEEWGEEVGGGGLACLALHRSGQEGPGKGRNESWRLVAAALGVHRLLETGALLLPLGVEQSTQQGHQEEQRARQAVALAAASGVYVRGGGCHMLEWTRGLRSGSNNGLASLELGFPFPPPGRGPAALSALLQPSDPRGVLSTAAAPPSSGLLSHLLPLTPGAPDRRRLRRISGAVSLYHHPGGGARADVLGSLNDAAMFYPWFQPHLNYAEPRPLPVRCWPFPPAWHATEADSAGEAGMDDGTIPAGYGALALVGCTSLTLPFLHELSGALRGRGPGITTRLREKRGLLDEDVAEVEENLEQILMPFEEEAERG